MGAMAGQARELRATLALAKADLGAGRLVAAAAKLDRAMRQLDAGIAQAKRAGVV